MIYSLTTGEKFSDFTSFGAYGAAMVSGMVGAVAGPVLSAVVDVFVAPAVEQFVNRDVNGSTFDGEKYIRDVGYNAVSTAITGGISAKVPDSVKDVYADAYIYGTRNGKKINIFYHIKKATTKAWNGAVDTVNTWFGNWRKK